MHKSLHNKINSPAVAADAVLFAIEQGQLKVLLIKIKNGPYHDKWATPGGLVQMDESLDDAAKRILFKKTNIGDVHLEQLYSFGEIGRDVRERAISVAYFALINDPRSFLLKTTSYYSEISWFSVRKLPPLAFDHQKIIECAYERLKSKLGYTNIVYSLLPEEFTLTELQKIYEIILDEKIDKRNFRKQIMSLNLVLNTGKKREGKQYRPAELFKFSQRKLFVTK